MSSTDSRPDVRPAVFGTLLGVAPGGVAAYSSDYESADERVYPNRHAYRSYLDGVYMGFKWQCVEFARRWLYLNRGYIFDDVAMAYEIFNLTHVRVVASNELLPLHAFANGSKRPPEPGCLLIWSEGGEFARTGHVAIVTEVLPDRIRLAEQNVDHRPWSGGRDYSREIEARMTEDGHYWVRCSFQNASILGWVIQTHDATFAESRRAIDRRLLNIVIRHLTSAPPADRAWLNEANPVEAAYVSMMKGHRLSERDEDQDRYVCIAKAAEEQIIRATNELHAMFLHATDYVLQDDRRLARFNLPEAIWPRIHQSWDNRRNQMITGRMDFALTPEGLKVYEYNSDSASCHTETGLVQGKWAGFAQCEDGRDPGEFLQRRLVQAWGESEATGLVHLLRDEDPEETYHALFMQEMMEAAGLQTKLLTSMAGFHWAEDGRMLDPDGDEVRWVWKTWAWETALDQIRAECEEDADRLRSYQPGLPRSDAPRLVDVLLRPNVMVFEPLWTLIPSNKAILPILWELFPGHENLLRSSYELTDDLRQGGYVVKPIVGRCGANIRLLDHNERVLEETGGRFESPNQIYQELFPLPRQEDLYVQICTFTAAGTYAGACVRTDRSRVIRWDSDLLPLRVVPNREFL
ncbi:MAG: bifunctional glutathionylspermidine amidase/synthase [Pseudomonadales bacterium]|nr:bifunctional glutathionylspermidine amidase/synthase [Pseudomonadales bacterium]MCP5182624.1 bifunctional glutathionylspermidine amidase/synthase [Pseudomonadales bacterium]